MKKLRVSAAGTARRATEVLEKDLREILADSEQRVREFIEETESRRNRFPMISRLRRDAKW